MGDLVCNWLGECAKMALGLKPVGSEKEQCRWVQHDQLHPGGSCVGPGVHPHSPLQWCIITHHARDAQG